MSISGSQSHSHRPTPLYFYGERAGVERARQFGEFCLRASSLDDAPSSLLPARPILPFGARKTSAASRFLTLSMSAVWSEKFVLQAQTVTHCLVINDTEEFGERLHRAVQKALPQWAGIDAAIAYGAPSPLGAAFTKSRHLAPQKEWLFAWRPMRPELPLQPIVIQIGCLDTLTEVRAMAQTGA